MTSPFDLKLYVENGMLKYVVYGTWQGKPNNEYGTISKLNKGYNTGDFSNLTLTLDGGRKKWIVKKYKFNIDGIYFDQNLLGKLYDVKDGHNKVNIYKNSAGEDWWVVYYNPEKEEEDSYTVVSGKNAPSNENPKSFCTVMFKSRKSKSKSSKSKRSKSKRSKSKRSKSKKNSKK
jgi:hypothetical protein